MTLLDIIAALKLPPESRVDQRVPKKLLLENGAPTAADKRAINEGIEDLTWLAALKPSTIGVADYRDGTREYLEIAVLCLVLRKAAKVSRLSELIHRAIPYPVLLAASQSDAIFVSLAHKRFAQNETGRMVLEGAPTLWSPDEAVFSLDWLDRLSLTVQPRGNLYEFYEGWISVLEAFEAAGITGRCTDASDSSFNETRRLALLEHARLQGEIAKARARAAKEKQVNRRVELNLELKKLEADLVRTTNLLKENA